MKNLTMAVLAVFSEILARGGQAGAASNQAWMASNAKPSGLKGLTLTILAS